MSLTNMIVMRGTLGFAAIVLCLTVACCSNGATTSDAGNDADAIDSGPCVGDPDKDGGGGELPPGTLSQWRPIGPAGGDRFLIRVDPHNPVRVVVVGHGGVHRSVNRGDLWEAVHDEKMQGSFFALDFDPTTPDRLAVGSNMKGVFVSDDFGDSWVPRSSGLPQVSTTEFFHEVQSLVFDDTGKLWASVRGAQGVSNVIFSSDDQGRSWLPSPGVPVAEVTQLFLVAGSLYAVSSSSGPYRHTGNAWESMAGDLSGEALAGTYLAVDHANPQRVFWGTRRAGLYRTMDGGTHWSHIDLPADLTPGDPFPLLYFVVIDPINPDLVWADLYTSESGTESPLFKPEPDQVPVCGSVTCGGLYFSTDGGDTWTHRVATPLGGFRFTLDASETVTDVLGTRSKYNYMTSGGMACVMRSDDGGVNFCRRIRGINGVFVNALREFDGMLYTAGEEGINYTNDMGERWSYRRAAGSLVYTWDFALDPNDANILIWATGEPAWNVPEAKGVWRSDISTCQETLPICAGDPPLTECPKANMLEGTGVWRLVRGDQLYALTQEDGIKVGTGMNSNWTDLSSGLSESSVTSMLLDEKGKPFIVGTRTCRGDYTNTCSWIPRPTEIGGAYYFEEGSWKKASGLTSAVLDLAHDKLEGKIYAATAQGVFRSTDLGRSFQATCRGLPELETLRVARSIVVDPKSPGVVYVGCLDGVFRTVNSGDDWEDVSNGLTNRVTDRMILSPGYPDRLYLATLGGSIFVAEINRWETGT